MGPWNTDQINRTRGVPFSTVLNVLGVYYERDKEYEALDPCRKGIRVQVGCQWRDFRFIVAGEKWLNEFLPAVHRNRGGGGAIDFLRHLAGWGFVHAVKVCLNTAEGSGRR